MEDVVLEQEQAAEAFSALIGDVPPEDTEETVNEPAAEETEEEEVEEDEADQPEDSDEVEEDEEDGDELFTVKVGDDEIQVSLDELINGYSRQSDYTRKTQAIAEQRRAVEELEQQYAQQIQAVQQIAQRLQQQPEIPEPNIDWQRLYDEDPIAWVRERELARDRQAQRDIRARELQAVAAEQERMQQHQFAQALEGQRQLLTELIPEWRDPDTAKAEKAAIREFAVKELGFSDEDIRQAYDARIVSALRKSWQFAQGSKQVEKQTKASTSKPAAKRGRSYKPEGRGPSNAHKRFAKSGSMDDAAQLFDEMFG
jgi:hypothetical protein